jgi:hypothetical protein
VTTDDAPVQEQHWDIQSMAALQNGVAVDVDDFDGGQRNRATERFQLAHHLIAKLTVVPMDDLQARVIVQVRPLLLPARSRGYMDEARSAEWDPARSA